MTYAQWYAPCPWSPPDHIWDPHTGGGSTRAGSNFEQSLLLLLLLWLRSLLALLLLLLLLQPARPPPPAASLVTITDHNKLNHNNGQGHNEPRVPGEHMCCSFTVSEVDATSGQKPPDQLLWTLSWSWGPPKKSSHRSGGWKTCQWNQVNLATSIGCNILRFFSFSCFSCQICYFCWRCLPMLIDAGHNLFQWIDLSFEDSGRIDWTKINVAKSKFSMLKSIEMRHPKHQSCKVQLHPAEEQDVEITLTLEENDECVGFQFFEAKQGAQKTNIVKMNSSLFIEVFNKSARVGAMEKRDLPVRSRIRKPEPASGTIHTFWSALWRRRMWNHCRDIFSIPLRSLGDVVGSLPRQSLPLTAQSKETRHRLKLVWKDSVVFESRRFECLLKFIKKSIFPKESLRMKGKPNWSSWWSWPSKSPKKPPSLDTNSCEHCTHQTK